MSFEDIMPIVSRWMTGIEALAALGAELSLKQSGQTAPPEVAAALSAVSTAAGLGDLDELAPQHQAMLAGLARLYVAHAAELLDNPGREPGWTYTDPIILNGWGRASGMVPGLIAQTHPDLGAVESFLDVGTGVGLLAVAAAGVWPTATIVGVDRWEPSLQRARENIAGAGLDDRITLRTQDVSDVDDVDRFDCVWVPTWFLAESVLSEALPRLHQATRPGGWIVLGRSATPPDPLAQATGALGTVRGGGSDVDAKHALALLEAAGFVDVHTVPPAVPVPVEFTLGQRAT